MTGLNDLSVLYVEDDPLLREYVAIYLQMHVGALFTAGDGLEGLEMVRKRRPDVVVSDIIMPRMDGLALTEALRKEFPALPVILCTFFTETAYLLKAIELGVRAYIPKPIDMALLLESIKDTARPILQQRELDRLKREALQTRGLVFGSSQVMHSLSDQVVQTAESDYSIIIQGEPGSGKSSVARLIHSMSRRQKRQLLTIDAQGRDPDQLEAELFGPPPGRGRPSATPDYGLLSTLHGSTLLLDAPEALTLPLQARLLRVIEEKSYTPTGSTSAVVCDLRILATSCANLAEEASSGRFRQDLLLCIGDHIITVPPLRERRGDIYELALRFLAEATDDLGMACPDLPPESLELLKNHTWPGNCRQLRQILRRSLLVSRGTITPTTLNSLLRASAVNAAPNAHFPTLKLDELERWAVIEALSASGGRKMEAARLLGVSYNTFKNKFSKSGLEMP